MDLSGIPIKWAFLELGLSEPVPFGLSKYRGAVLTQEFGVTAHHLKNITHMWQTLVDLKNRYTADFLEYVHNLKKYNYICVTVPIPIYILKYYIVK